MKDLSLLRGRRRKFSFKFHFKGVGLCALNFERLDLLESRRMVDWKGKVQEALCQVLGIGCECGSLLKSNHGADSY